MKRATPGLESQIPKGHPTGSRRDSIGQHVRDRRTRLWHGAVAEMIAAVWLMLKGYRILGWRHRTRLGEIDLIAVRGRRIAFVEVKKRRTIEDAQASISDWQTARIGNAAEQWVWTHPRYRDHEMGLDAVLVGSRCWPQHVLNALQPA